jgi:hypothetical protein
MRRAVAQRAVEQFLVATRARRAHGRQDAAALPCDRS